MSAFPIIIIRNLNAVLNENISCDTDVEEPIQNIEDIYASLKII